MSPSHFRELDVWQVSMSLAKLVYRLTSNFPREERYGLTSQLQRSAVSIPSNIAEGNARSGMRDYARFGLFMLGGGVAGGQKVLPDDWIAAATTKQTGIDVPGRGYGYQWWTNDDGSFAAQGIFGQGIFIDPKRRLVIASNGNWPTATDPEGVGSAREAFYKSVQAAVDKEAK